MKIKYVVISISLHALFVVLILFRYSPYIRHISDIYPPKSIKTTIVVEIVTKPTIGGYKSKQGLKPTPVYSNLTLPDDLDTKIAQEYWVNKVKALIDPEWRRRIRSNLDYRKRTQQDLHNCVTLLRLVITDTGEILSKEVITSCEYNKAIDDAATGVWDYIGRVPPPPSTLLKGNTKMVFFWEFDVSI